MTSPFLPFALAAIVSVLIGVGVAMEPYSAGDVTIARALQSALPDAEWWATPISRLAPAPANYYVIGLTALLAFALAGGYAGAWPWSFSGTDAYGRLPVEPLQRFAQRYPELVNPRRRA